MGISTVNMRTGNPIVWVSHHPNLTKLNGLRQAVMASARKRRRCRGLSSGLMDMRRIGCQASTESRQYDPDTHAH